MITLHFHLLPQYKYELFHIYFTWFHCTGRNELNKLTLLPMCGFITQLVEHRTGIAEVMGSNAVEALIFFRLLLSSCLNWKIYCDDHTSLSSTTAVQIWIISYIFHKTKICFASFTGLNGRQRFESFLYCLFRKNMKHLCSYIETSGNKCPKEKSEAGFCQAG